MVNTVKYDWTDGAWQRVVPVKIYSPNEQSSPFPVIIFSHGLGSSRDVYGYLGRHWASHGFISVHVQHAGSDAVVWEGFPVSQRMELLRRAASLPENFKNRPKDITFAIDELTRLNQTDSQWKNRLDLNRIGVAGHSFGAFTALATIGEMFSTPRGEQLSFRDPRIKAAVAMSPPVFPSEQDRDVTYAEIAVPCLHITGTEDDSPIGDTKAAERRLPFEHISAARQYLITFTGGDHFIFSGRWAEQSGGEHDKMFQELILSSSTAFWNAHLKNDPDALRWLNDGFSKELGDLGVLEKKG